MFLSTYPTKFYVCLSCNSYICCLLQHKFIAVRYQTLTTCVTQKFIAVLYQTLTTRVTQKFIAVLYQTLTTRVTQKFIAVLYQTLTTCVTQKFPQNLTTLNINSELHSFGFIHLTSYLSVTADLQLMMHDIKSTYLLN